MLQKHSCWPWVGRTLQVPQPGQVPSAPAGFVPFLMPLLYLSYIHSVTPPSVPTDPRHRLPNLPALSQGNRNQSILRAAVCTTSSELHQALPCPTLITSPPCYLDCITPNLRCHCTSCISWLSPAHDLHKLLTNPPSLFSCYWSGFQFLNLWWFPLITFITSPVSLLQSQMMMPIGHSATRGAFCPTNFNSWKAFLRPLDTTLAGTSPLLVFKEVLISRNSFSCFLLTQVKILREGWHGPHAFRVFQCSNFSITSAQFPSIFLLYAKGNLSFILAPALPSAFVNTKENCHWFFFFKQCPSINNPQQLLESFHRWSIIPLAHATFLIIYYNLFHCLPSISHHCLSCQLFYSLVRSAFAASGPSIITSLFTQAGLQELAGRQHTT